MSDELKAKEYCSEVKKRLFGPYRVSLGIFPPAVQRNFQHTPDDDCADDSVMSNLSHVAVKQHACVRLGVSQRLLLNRAE